MRPTSPSFSGSEIPTIMAPSGVLRAHQFSHPSGAAVISATIRGRTSGSRMFSASIPSAEVQGGRQACSEVEAAV